MMTGVRNFSIVCKNLSNKTVNKNTKYVRIRQYYVHKTCLPFVYEIVWGKITFRANIGLNTVLQPPEYCKQLIVDYLCKKYKYILVYTLKKRIYTYKYKNMHVYIYIYI